MSVGQLLNSSPAAPRPPEVPDPEVEADLEPEKTSPKSVVTRGPRLPGSTSERQKKWRETHPDEHRARERARIAQKRAAAKLAKEQT